jgi:hypothetical protein
MLNAVAVAQKFAKALDADEHDAASALWDDHCLYGTGKSVSTGKMTIIESYRKASNWTLSAFDEVIYESELNTP